jgi:uncharacterized membrane protein
MVIDVIHAAVMAVFYAISLTGVIVVVWGVTEAIARFFALKREHKIPHARLIAKTARIRERLGSHLLLALDLFIGADIIKSVVTPGWQNIAMLGAIVFIRIVLSYFLEREMERTHQSARSGRLSDTGGNGRDEPDGSRDAHRLP